MEKSPSPGNTSLESGTQANKYDANKGMTSLSKLASSTTIQSLKKALNDSELCLVGGAVRDAFIGIESADIDLATKLHPDQVEQRLTTAGIRTIATGLEHGTLTALINDVSVEITTFRTPGKRSGSSYSDTIETDLAGRDFTINAIAFQVSNQTIVDPFNGREALAQGKLAAVGSAYERFVEDPLRILRFIRFGPAAGRVASEDLLSAATALAKSLHEVSPERIKGELEHIILSSSPREAFKVMLATKILEVIIPEFLDSVGFEQNEFHTEDVFNHTLTVVERAKADRIVKLAALFHDMGKPATYSVGQDGRVHFYKHEIQSEIIAKNVMTRMKFSHDDIQRVALLVRQHMRPIDCGPSGVRRLLRDLADNYSIWRDLKIADAPPIVAESEFSIALNKFDSMVESEATRLKGSVYGALAVDGEDLKSIGFREGRALGKAIKQLWEIVLDDPNLNEREYLLTKAKQMPKS